MKFFTAVTALSAALVASAANITVLVGQNGTLTYSPQSVTAQTGDIISFEFLTKNHTVTQSTFATPCNQSGIDSGFFPVAANATQVPQWSFTVENGSTPLWFYCRQIGHCQMGMVFAVNPTATKTYADFQGIANGTLTAAQVANGTANSTTSSSASGPSASPVTGNSTNSTAKSGAISNMAFSTSAGALTLAALLAGVAL